MAKKTFDGFNEFETQLKMNFPVIHFTRVQLHGKRNVCMVNAALGIVVKYNYDYKTAQYYRFVTPKELSLVTLTKLLLYYNSNDDMGMENLMREFIHYQKRGSFVEPQVYADLANFYWVERDMRATFPMLNTHASYDKESENFNRAMAVFRKSVEKGIDSIKGFTNAFEYAHNTLIGKLGKKAYYDYANELQHMGVPAEETFSGEYFDALSAQKKADLGLREQVYFLVACIEVADLLNTILKE